MLAVLAAGFLAALCFVFAHRENAWVTPDGWAYWQGAISLNEGRGYAYFSGHPILAWPPLYSLYLAMWTSVFGPMALSVNLAAGSLVTMESIAWLALTLKLAPEAGRLRPVAAGLAAIYITAFLSFHQRELLAHSLLYLFLPLQIMLAQAIIASEAPKLRLYAGLAVCSLLASLSHNTGLGFTAAIAAAIVLLGKQRGARMLPLMVVVLATGLAWALARIAFGQAGSHAVGLGRAAHSPLEYLVQGIFGAAELFAPGPAGWIILGGLVMLVVTYRRDRGVQLASVLTGLCFLASLALFSVVSVRDEFGGRFLQFVPLLMAPVLMLRLAADAGPRLALFAALVLPSIVYASAMAAVSGPLGDRVPNAAAISRNAPRGELVRRHERLLIGPIDWEEPAAGNRQASR